MSEYPRMLGSDFIHSVVDVESLGLKIIAYVLGNELTLVDAVGLVELVLLK